MKRSLRLVILAVLCAGGSSAGIAATHLWSWFDRGSPAIPRPSGRIAAGPTRSGPGGPPHTRHRDIGPEPTKAAATGAATDGALRLGDGTACPLAHTDVQAEISGFIARVTVRQEFLNPTPDRVEAVYTFPLPPHAAVDDLTMHVGGHVIKGVIAERDEARRLYERARKAGHTAALLEQERPNVFTQSVANIPPHGPVTVEISYAEVLEYADGGYAFVFPMVVGPRYIPGEPERPGVGGWSPDTTRVPDASRITPPVAGVHVGERGSRAGHDISLAVTLDAGVPVRWLASPTHATEIERPSARAAVVRLRNEREIPNRDFVLQYATAGEAIQDALLAHAPDRDGGGYLALVLQPPARVPYEEVAPRELIFVLDTSGSMSGYPIETAKRVVRRAIHGLRPGDTFNLVTFAGDTTVLFARPVEATTANVERALAFLERRSGNGGTEMMKAIRVALGGPIGGGRCAERPSGHEEGEPDGCDGPPRDLDGRVRIVCFMTDGYVGNDMEIIGAVQQHAAARVFSFGIGSSVNRFLLDGMARAGRGEVEYVLREEDAEAAASRFYERVDAPVLTDVVIDWGTLPVEQVVPGRAADLFAARPLVVLARYRQAASGTVTVGGTRAGEPFRRSLRVSLPAHQPAQGAIAQLWARQQVEALMAEDWAGAQRLDMRRDLRQRITQLGLEFRLVTPFTAFVAVEERTVVEGGVSRTVRVPVEVPAGVDPDGVFGSQDAASFAMAKQPLRVGGYGPGGVVGGRVGGLPSAPPPPAAATGSAAPVLQERVGPLAGRDLLPVEPEPRRLSETELSRKLHVSLAAVVACVEKSRATVEVARCGTGVDGRVAVELRLGVAPDDALRQRLTDAGFAPDAPVEGRPRSARTIAGRVAVAQLRELAALPEVMLIAAKR